MSHHHFTLDERMFIQLSKELKLSHRAIARKLGVSHSAVNYEVKERSFVIEYTATSRVNKPRILTLDLRSRRGKGEVPAKLAAKKRWQERLARYANGQPTYDAIVAEAVYLERRALASQSNLKLRDGNELAKRIKTMLMSENRDSPEQIAGNLAKTGENISAQTIYNWINKSKDKKILVKGLRRRGRRYRYSKDTEKRWNKGNEKRSIHTRPVEVEKLTRYGDLEGDTIVGANKKDRILTHLDRRTGMVSLSLILGYNSHNVHRQTLKDIHRVFGDNIHTITYDNGVEFSAWKLTEAKLNRGEVSRGGISEGEVNTKIYFADPYRSSQRGRNENVNGLIRDYFPKGTDFKKLAKRDVQKVEDILNNRSRKRYSWRSPFEERRLVLNSVNG